MRSAAVKPKKYLTIPHGMSSHQLVSVAERVPLFALPVNAMTLRISTQVTELSATDVGIRVCIPNSPKWRTETTVLHKRSDSVRDLCTSLFTIPKTMTVSLAVWDAEDAYLNVLYQ
jgi:hypothetical protein